MTQNEKELVKWFFDLVGYFNHYEFFTKRLWKKVKGFEKEDEAEIKCMFMHYWFHYKFGYYTCPCGSSWFTVVDKDSYDRYITEYKPIIDAFAIWMVEQR